MNDPQERACAHCNHAHHSSDELYECRVWPPETIHDDDGAARLVFPLTLAEMWCGQFVRKVN